MFVYLNFDDGTNKSIPIPTYNPPNNPTSTPTSRRSADYYYNQGNKEYEKGNYTKAIGLFTQALNRDKNHHKSRHRRSQSHYSNKDFRNAMKDADYLCIYRKNSEDYGLRGWIKLQTNKFSSSIMDFDTAVRLATENSNMSILVDSYIGRGLSKYSNKEYTRALSDATKAIRIQDDNPDVYYLRGLIFLDMNPPRVVKGCKDLQKSRDLGSKLISDDEYEENCN